MYTRTDGRLRFFYPMTHFSGHTNYLYYFHIHNQITFWSFCCITCL